MKKKIWIYFLALPMLACAQENRNVKNETNKPMGVKEFFKKAFSDMKEEAKAQHELDKANFEAVKAESKANFEAAKRTPDEMRAERQKAREQQARSLAAKYKENLDIRAYNALLEYKED
jgi:ABC-type transporter MlaC component